MENAYLHELYFENVSEQTVDEIYEYLSNNINLFDEICEQINIKDKRKLLQELNNIYHFGAKNGIQGLIYCNDMNKCFDKNEDEIIDWLNKEAGWRFKL